MFCNGHFTEMEICSETDSTNECSDFKSELDEDEESAQQQQSGQKAGAANASGPVSRKSSGPSQRKNTARVVFV